MIKKIKKNTSKPGVSLVRMCHQVAKSTGEKNWIPWKDLAIVNPGGVGLAQPETPSWHLRNWEYDGNFEFNA